MKPGQSIAVVGFAVGILLASQAQATFIVDDFNTASDYLIMDNENDDNAVIGGAVPVDGANIVMTNLPAVGPTVPVGWSRSISADMEIGSSGGPDNVKTEVCSTCKAGQFTADGASGVGQWIYDGNTNPLDLTQYNLTGAVWFRYASNWSGASGVDLTIELIDAGGGSSSALWDELERSSDLVMAPEMMLSGNADLSQVTGLVVTVRGDDLFDFAFTIDDISLQQQQQPQPMPVPAPIALMGLGVVALRWSRRR